MLGLLRSGLLAIPDFDTFLAKAPDAGRSAPGLAFAMRIAQRSIVMDRLLAPSELPLTLELLVRVASRHASTAMAMNQQGGGVSLPVPPQLPALLQAIKAGANEALMLDPHGFVASCNSTNFFIVKNGRVRTSTGRFNFCGITRANVIGLCREAGADVMVAGTSVFGASDRRAAIVALRG